MARPIYFWNGIFNDNYEYVQQGGNWYMTPESVAQVAYDAGFRGEALLIAVAISGRESSFSPVIHGTDASPGTLQADRGLWQINQGVWDKPLYEAGIISSYESAQGNLDLFDPLTSAKAAFFVSRGGSDWTAWSAKAGVGYDPSGFYLEGTNVSAAAEAIRNAGLSGEIEGWNPNTRPKPASSPLPTPTSYPAGNVSVQGDLYSQVVRLGFGPVDVDSLPERPIAAPVNQYPDELTPIFQQSAESFFDELSGLVDQNIRRGETSETSTSRPSTSDGIRFFEQTVERPVPETGTRGRGTSTTTPIRQVEGSGTETGPTIRTETQPSIDKEEALERIAANLQDKYGDYLLDPTKSSGLTAQEKAILDRVRNNPNEAQIELLRDMALSGWQSASGIRSQWTGVTVPGQKSDPMGAIESVLKEIGPISSDTTSIRQIEGPGVEVGATPATVAPTTTAPPTREPSAPPTTMAPTTTAPTTTAPTTTAPTTTAPSTVAQPSRIPAGYEYVYDPVQSKMVLQPIGESLPPRNMGAPQRIPTDPYAAADAGSLDTIYRIDAPEDTDTETEQETEEQTGGQTGGQTGNWPWDPSPVNVEKDLETTLNELYPGYWMIVKNNPEVAELFERKINEGLTDTEFQALLRETTWWQTTNASVRDWDVSSQRDPATAEAYVVERSAIIEQTALDRGIKLGGETLRQLSLDSLRMGWSDQMILNAIGMEAIKSGTTGISQLGQGYYGQTMRRYASDYGVSLADTTFNSYLNKIAVGEENINSFQDYVMTIGKSLYPTLSEQFDAGLTFDNITDGYRQVASNILERDPNDIDMVDPMFVTAVTYQPDAGTGEQRMMNMAEWGDYLRQNESLGYQYTTQARSRAYEVADKIANMFGRI